MCCTPKSNGLIVQLQNCIVLNPCFVLVRFIVVCPPWVHKVGWNFQPFLGLTAFPFACFVSDDFFITKSSSLTTMRVQHALPSETSSRALSFRSVMCFYHALRCPTFVHFLRFCLSMAGAIISGNLLPSLKYVSMGEYKCRTDE